MTPSPVILIVPPAFVALLRQEQPNPDPHRTSRTPEGESTPGPAAHAVNHQLYLAARKG